jgi:SAM-dependent methyltransferase
MRASSAKSCVVAEAGHRKDGRVTGNADTDWAGYYAWSSGREPRPMLLAACSRLGAGDGRLAVDLGCGEGTDTLALLDRGWSVLAIDTEPAGLASLRTRIPAACSGCIRIECASFADAALPPAHLIHAGFSLPFCPPHQFPAVWAQIRRALAHGAIFAGQFFGTRDSWADDPGMTFQNRAEVISLLDGLEILELNESERDGEAYSGPKHWHIYDILAREHGPASAAVGQPSGTELPTSDADCHP